MRSRADVRARRLRPRRCADRDKRRASPASDTDLARENARRALRSGHGRAAAVHAASASAPANAARSRCDLGARRPAANRPDRQGRRRECLRCIERIEEQTARRRIGTDVIDSSKERRVDRADRKRIDAQRPASRANARKRAKIAETVAAAQRVELHRERRYRRPGAASLTEKHVPASSDSTYRATSNPPSALEHGAQGVGRHVLVLPRRVGPIGARPALRAGRECGIAHAWLDPTVRAGAVPDRRPQVGEASSRRHQDSVRIVRRAPSPMRHDARTAFGPTLGAFGRSALEPRHDMRAAQIKSSL